MSVFFGNEIHWGLSRYRLERFLLIANEPNLSHANAGCFEGGVASVNLGASLVSSR